MIELLWLLLPVAAASGWWIARQETPKKSKSFEDAFDFSLDEPPSFPTKDCPPDEALALELGRFLRQQGKLSQAIHHHRQLLNQSQNLAFYQQVQWELAEDFMAAGLVDRAESLFKELVSQENWHSAACRKLIELAERQQDWQQAIALSEKLHQSSPNSSRIPLSHYRCELGEMAAKQMQWPQARAHLRAALADHPACGRARLRWGTWAAQFGEERETFEIWTQLSQQTPEWVEEIAPTWLEMTQTLRPELLKLWHTLDSNQAGGQFTVAMAQLIANQQSPKAAQDYLVTKLKAHPNAQGLCFLLHDNLHDSTLKSQIPLMLHWPKRYRCHRCGYTGAHLHWCCPSCRTWESTFPLIDRLPPADFSNF